MIHGQHSIAFGAVAGRLALATPRIIGIRRSTHTGAGYWPCAGLARHVLSTCPSYIGVTRIRLTGLLKHVLHVQFGPTATTDPRLHVDAAVQSHSLDDVLRRVGTDVAILLGGYGYIRRVDSGRDGTVMCPS